MYHQHVFNILSTASSSVQYILILLKNLLICILVMLILFGYLVTRITQYQTTMYICSLTAITTAAYLAKKHNTPFSGSPGKLLIYPIKGNAIVYSIFFYPYVLPAQLLTGHTCCIAPQAAI